jgi:conjugative transfer signal peptidase TraF
MTRADRLSITFVSVLAIGALAVPRQDSVLIWNATASTPIGLYALEPSGHLHVMDLVAIKPPARIARFLAAGGFLPGGVLLLKHVLAFSGQTVCRIDDEIFVDGATVAEAKDYDHLDRPLPVWTGCLTLSADEIFVLNPSVPGSLDGRYFGPIPLRSIIGQATPLWTEDVDTRRFRWRVATP